jgi:hypothetical protein
MRHRILTCRNHPGLRWSCKDIAWTPAAGQVPGHYNGCRNIQFRGMPSGEGMFSDGSGLDCTMAHLDLTPVEECDCPSTDLVLAPEDASVVEH